MPRIESLRTYPVAGMDGYEVGELQVTPEAINANRSLAVVLQSEIDHFFADSSYIPLRMTQVRFPQLTLFQTEERNGNVIITFKQEELNTGVSAQVESTDRPFLNHDSYHTQNPTQLLRKAVLPFRVSNRSTSSRWAIDMGDENAQWLSQRVGQPVRLVKAVKTNKSAKHHFTWYTHLHAIAKESLTALSIESQTQIDPLTFRYNMLLSGLEAPFDEESWQEVVIADTAALVSACERCGYIGIDRATAALAHYAEVLKTVSQRHQLNFGIYIQPDTHGTLTLRVGDLVEVTART